MYLSISLHRHTTSCSLALTGTTVGGTDIRPFTSTNSLTGDALVLGSTLTDGATIFSTIRCSNEAGLQGTAHSDGVTIVTTAPDVSNATVDIVVQSPSYHEARNAHQADASRLVFRWSGITDPSGIGCIQVRRNDFVLFRDRCG